ncbi:CvfB family protein [Aneurinibacillus tyrosinisolvens]|uniref:CvfB family protein n=1 Tax=Aneurinibacillus tyrosinisolvens TaxID=1443435 RepID=UPI00063FACBE|nr:S1-like domain-containing RNA-binding protein [Aneurinibacillus tyrosinisolvens]
MSLEAGTKVQMKVERKAPFGYFLSSGDTDVLLHESDTEGEVEIGDTIDVYLYHDHQDRLAATQHTPHVLLGEFSWLEVVDIHPRMGAFLNNGMRKDLLLPADQLPEIKDKWPRAGDRVYVQLEHDKQGRMLAVLGKEEDFEEITHPAPADLFNQDVTGYVYKIIKIGAFLLTEGQHLGFLHKDETTEPLRVGQKVTARVSRVREDGRINLTMKQRKEVSYSQDAETIYVYLQNRNGRMPYTDKTEPDIIKQKFGISKAAFKRALGKLMKEKKVYQEDGWTIITENK